MSLPCAGCGSGLMPVSGSVTLDGTPVVEAFVSFKPAEGGRPVSTVTDAAGRFEFRTDTVGGLAAGVYQVTVTKTELVGTPPDQGSLTAIPPDFDGNRVRERWITPPRYAKSETSGLSSTVERGMPPVELVLVSE